MTMSTTCRTRARQAGPSSQGYRAGMPVCCSMTSCTISTSAWRNTLLEARCTCLPWLGVGLSCVNLLSLEPSNLQAAWSLPASCAAHASSPATLRQLRFWADSGRPIRKAQLRLQLRKAYSAFQKYLKDSKLRCSQKRFTPSRINAESATDTPCLAAKAANAKVVVHWLAGEAQSYAANAAQLEACLACVAPCRQLHLRSSQHSRTRSYNSLAGTAAGYRSSRADVLLAGIRPVAALSHG